MKSHDEETGRVVAVAAAAWGAAIGMAALEGAFARFAASSVGLFAVLASLYAVAAYFVDPQLRAYAMQTDPWRAAQLAAVLDLALWAALALAGLPLVTFLAPLATLANVAAAERWLARGRVRRKTRTAPAKSPGARPAAT